MTKHNSVFSSTLNLNSCFMLFLLVLLTFQILSPCVLAQADRNEIIAGVMKNFPPESYIDRETGKPVGFAIDIIDEIARLSGLKVRYVIFDSGKEMNQALKNGSIDVQAIMGIIEERQDFVDFTTPVYAFDIKVFVRSTTTDIHGVNDLAGRKVAVVKENKGLYVMQQRGDAELVLYDTIDEAFLSLISGNVDALVFPEPLLMNIAMQSGLEDRIMSVGESLLEVKRAIGVRKGEPELLSKLDAQVKEFIVTPEYEKIYAKWYSKPEPYWNTQRVLMVVGITVALVAAIFFIIHYFSVLGLNKKLRESEERHRVLVDNSMDAILLTAPDGSILSANPAACSMFGRTEEEICRLGRAGVVDMIDPRLSTVLEERTRIGKVCGELSFVRKDGTKFQGEISSAIFKDKDGLERTSMIIRDISERKRAEEKIQKANRVYAVISQINQAIVRVRDKDKILSEACRIAVEYGKFQMAWIGFVDEQIKLVNPVAYSGVEDGYLSKIKRISVEDVPEGRGPTGAAIRENRHYVCDDIEKDPRMAPWREEAQKCGYRSSIALPIKHFDKVIGAFSLYASVPHFFDQEEIHLLDEVTNDISFALESIEIIQKKNEAEEALRKSEEKYRNLVERSNDGILIIQDELVKFANVRLAELWGGSVVELLGTPLIRHIHPDELDKVMERYQRRMANENVPPIYETVLLRKDGTAVHIEINAGVIIYKGKPADLVMIRDITERKRAEENLKAANKRFEDVLNSIDSLVYAIDMKTYEILFINKFGRDNWGEIEGKICWQTLQKGQSGPCEFCTNKRLIGPDGKPSEMVVWDFQNTSNKRWYDCMDRAIYWPDGRLVRIEIATDITQHKQMEEELHKLNAELEQRVKERTAELEEKNTDLARMNKLFVGRELRMIELKEQMAKLEKERGKK